MSDLFGWFGSTVPEIKTDVYTGSGKISPDRVDFKADNYDVRVSATPDGLVVLTIEAKGYSTLTLTQGVDAAQTFVNKLQLAINMAKLAVTSLESK